MRHTADVEAEIAAPFRCARCKASGSARVIGHGIGSGQSVLGVGAALADQAALAEAREDAARDARSTVALAKCPSCGHRSHLALAKVVIPALAAFLLLGSFTIVMLMISSTFALLLGVLTAFLAFAALASAYNRLTAAPQIQLAPPRAVAVRIPDAPPGDEPRLLQR